MNPLDYWPIALAAFTYFCGFRSGRAARKWTLAQAQLDSVHRAQRHFIQPVKSYRYVE